MVASQPLSINQLLHLFEEDKTLQPERADIRSALEQLQLDYQGRGIEIIEVASGFRVQARDDYAAWINRLFDERPPRYSRALLETLAIIAYRQPITRAEIEDIRGVSVSSGIIKTLQEREWIKTVGHRDVPGKPALLATTKGFLDYFNLKKLSDLPALADIKDFDAINPDLFEALDGDKSAVPEKETDSVAQNQETEPALASTEAVTASESVSVQSEPAQSEQNEVQEIEDEDTAPSAQVIPFSN